MGEPNWDDPPEKPRDPEQGKDLYYVVYPDLNSPRSLNFEAYATLDEARACCKRLDTGHPTCDFVVLRGPIIGFVLEDAFQEF